MHENWEWSVDDELVAVAHDELDDDHSKIICSSANDHFYGLISKISKSAKKGPFLNIFNFLMNLDFL